MNNNKFLPCDDFFQFKKLLTNLRKADDRIINELNSALPTESFTENIDKKSICQRFYEEMIRSHLQRELTINKCVKEKTEYLQSIMNSNDVDRSAEIRKEHNLIRQYKAEKFEEEIISDASSKIFYQRCRDFYKPKDLRKFE